MYNLRTSLHHAQTACDIFDTQNKLQFLDGYQRTRGAYGSVSCQRWCRKALIFQAC